MQSNKFKIVYSNWVKETTPLANGLHPAVVQWIKQKLENDPSLTFNNIYLRCNEIEEHFQKPNSGYIFHHISFYHYFKKHYGEENIVSDTNIVEDDDNTYLLPYELEMSNIEWIYGNLPFKIGERTYEYKFIETLSPSLLQLVKKGKVKILLASLTEFSYGKDTLTKLERFFRSFDIDPVNVIYLVGNTVLNYTGSIIQGSSHATLHQQAEIATRYPIAASSLGYFCDYPKIEDLDKTKYRSKKFLSWNRTMNRPHRIGLAYLALKYDLLKDGMFSFLHGMQNYANSQLEYLIDEDSSVINQYVNKIRSMIPYEIDTHHLPTEKKEGFQSNENNKKEIYVDAYLHITSETLFDSVGTPFLSEKTFRPILNLQPFIYLGNYKGLEEIRRLGFKTFHGYIDESYDLEQDPKKRFALIEKEIKRFSEMSKEELHDWYYSLVDILIYNQKHFLTFNSYNPLHDFLTRLSNGN